MAIGAQFSLSTLSLRVLTEAERSFMDKQTIFPCPWMLARCNLEIFTCKTENCQASRFLFLFRFNARKVGPSVNFTRQSSAPLLQRKRMRKIDKKVWVVTPPLNWGQAKFPRACKLRVRLGGNTFDAFFGSPCKEGINSACRSDFLSLTKFANNREKAFHFREISKSQWRTPWSGGATKLQQKSSRRSTAQASSQR